MPSHCARLFLGQALERLVVTRVGEELRQCTHGREPEQVGVSATARSSCRRSRPWTRTVWKSATMFIVGFFVG